MTQPQAFTGLDERFERLPIDQVVVSKTNPRSHFPETYLQQLADSIRDKGVIQPVLVRQVDAGSHKPMRFEIIAGECRYRATKIAGVSHIPAVIRQYSDEQVLELQLIENIHRNDLTPLEQAKGYRALIDSNPTKHSAESIAARIGMSPAWVWDRMKLLDLVPEAKQILEQERMSVGHAILIARLKPEDQKRVIAFDDDSSTAHRGVGLWRPDHGIEFDDNTDAKRSKYDGLKPCSVRELEAWINDHIRFDVAHAAKAQPLTFEPLAAKVEEVVSKPGRGRKMIAITFDHFTQPEARSEDERTYGPKSFKFADGQQHTDTYPRRTYTAPTCEYAVLGVVAAGDGRGQSFDVCIARDKCQVHWKKEIAAKDKSQKLRDSGQGSKAAKREQAAEARERRERERRERDEKRWNAFKPALAKAAHAAAAKVPSVLPKPLYAKVLAHFRLPATTTPAQLQKAMLEDALKEVFDRYSWKNDEPKMVAWAKLLGVDVKSCEPKAEVTHTSGVGKKAGKSKKAAA